MANLHAVVLAVIIMKQGALPLPSLPKFILKHCDLFVTFSIENSHVQGH